MEEIERFLPSDEITDIHYEHINRYLFARQFVSKKKILDLGCGEGYGTKILSENASFTLGIDSSPKVIEHANSKYNSKNLDFELGSIIKLPLLKDHTFDVITCFETIEHINEQEDTIDEVTRLLKEDGLFIISTPNKPEYQKHRNSENPFHKRELSYEEFLKLLKRKFKNIVIAGQNIFQSSNIWLMNDKSSKFYESTFEIIDNKVDLNGKKIPMYLIAVCTNNKNKVKIDQSFSITTDESKTYYSKLQNEIVSQKEVISISKQFIDDLQNEIVSQKEVISKSKQFIDDLHNQIASHKEETSKSKQFIDDLQNEIASHKEETSKSKQFIDDLQNQISSKNKEILQSSSFLQKLEQNMMKTSKQLNDYERKRSKYYSSRL